MEKRPSHKTRLKTIGRREFVSLPDMGFGPVEAKVDTGAFRTALHCLSCRQIDEGDRTILEAVFDLDGTGARTFYFDQYAKRQVRSSFGETEMRFCVRIWMKLGRKKIKSEVSLTDRSDMRYQVLIGRKTLQKRYVVDVSKIFVLGS